MRRRRYIDSTWTYNGKVFLKKSPSASPRETNVEEDLRPLFLEEFVVVSTMLQTMRTLRVGVRPIEKLV